MGGFAFHIAGDGQARSVPIDQALAGDASLIWVHLLGHTEEAQAWLRDIAQLDAYVVDALTATETRPRCEKVGDGALLNLRGRSKVELDSSDLLASVRIFAQAGRVFSVTRSPLYASAEVKGEVERGEVRDPGDLITAFATAITEDLDPQVAELGDCLDDCEESLDRQPRVRSSPAGHPRPRQRDQLPPLHRTAACRRWRSSPLYPAIGLRRTTASTSPALPIVPRAWPRSWRRSAKGRRWCTRR